MHAEKGILREQRVQQLHTGAIPLSQVCTITIIYKIWDSFRENVVSLIMTGTFYEILIIVDPCILTKG